MINDIHLLLWAKANRQTGQTHPLICHMLDVGQAALALWQEAFSSSTRRSLSDLVGLKPDNAGRLFAFWIALHDIGKASPAFQIKYQPKALELEAAGLPFPNQAYFTPAPHGLVSAWALTDLFEENGIQRWPAQLLARALGGHHGSWPTSDELLGSNRSANLGGQVWDQVRRGLFTELQALFQPPGGYQLPKNQKDLNVLLTLFSGWTSAADWIGSMEERFTFAENPIDPECYLRTSSQAAHRAVNELGWTGWTPTGSTIPFDAAFPFTPNEVQAQVIAAAQNASLPALAILEAPTGIGKTEAALYLADCWLQNSQGKGIYVAMPTQATSNQMFARTRSFLALRYPSDLVNLHLAHGQALWSDAMKEILLYQIGEDTQAGVAAMGWFLPRKRTLLTPFGVGTVDQALLSVLQTRHFFVRLFGLENKVVIFDEVHAYDTYMSTLFFRLLEWLRAVNTSVIILSATLPDGVRNKIVTAYAGRAGKLEETATYPRLTLADNQSTLCYALPEGTQRTLRLERIGRAGDDITGFLAQCLKDGGCAAVICNTVGRSQELYDLIKARRIVPDDECILFHARFPYTWRMEKEEKVLGKFGKQGDRPHKAIVIATQVIEQSLDLDFDLIITDLAPVDLLIQRAGRLHRHLRETRPAGVTAPTLAITQPNLNTNGIPEFGSDAFVYEEHILLRSYLAVSGLDALTLPRDTRRLIELVYDEKKKIITTDPLREALQHSWKAMQKRNTEAASEAKLRLVLPADDEDLLLRHNLGLEEEAPEVNKAFQALTRLAPPGVSLVCLHCGTNGEMLLDPEDPTSTLDLENEPDRRSVERLLKSSVNVQSMKLVRYFAGQPMHDAWKNTAALRNHYPVIFDKGCCRLDGLLMTLYLDREHGLAYEMEVE